MREQVVSVTLEPSETCKVSFKATVRVQHVYDVKCETAGGKVNIKVDGKRNVNLEPIKGLKIEKS